MSTRVPTAVSVAQSPTHNITYRPDPGTLAAQTADLADRFGVSKQQIAGYVGKLDVPELVARHSRLLGVLSTRMLALAAEHGGCVQTGCRLCEHISSGLAAIVAENQVIGSRMTAGVGEVAGR